LGVITGAEPGDATPHRPELAQAGNDGQNWHQEQATEGWLERAVLAPRPGRPLQL